MINNKIDTRPYPPSGHGHSYPPSGHGQSYPPSGHGSSYPRPAALTHWHKEKPFRPPYYHSRPEVDHDRPSLNKYEQTFTQQFLDPPKPGGIFTHIYIYTLLITSKLLIDK